MPEQRVAILDCNFPDINIEKAVLAEIGASPAFVSVQV